MGLLLLLLLLLVMEALDTQDLEEELYSVDTDRKNISPERERRRKV